MHRLLGPNSLLSQVRPILPFHKPTTDNVQFSGWNIWRVVFLTISLAITYAAIETLLILTLRVGRRLQL
jgi:hypothetical protein